MVDAEVKYVIDATQVDKGTRSLERHAAAGAKAGTAANRFEKQLATQSQRAKDYSTQANKASLYTANLGAQFNDIGVMLAAGQSPLLLAVQQGTQINQVMAQIGGSGTDKLKAFGAAMKSMLGVSSLVTIGTIAAVAAVGQLAIKAVRSVNDVMELEEAVKAAADALKSFGEAADNVNLSFSDMVKEFGSASPALQTALSDIAAVEKLRATEALDEMSRSVAGLVTNLSWFDDRSEISAIQDFLGLGSIGSTSRETAAAFAQLLHTLETTADQSERLQASLDLRQMLSDATNGFQNMNDEQEKFRLNLAFVVRDAEILGGTIKKAEGAVIDYGKATLTATAYGKARAEYAESFAKAEEEAAAFAEAGVAALLEQAEAAKELEAKRQDALAAIEREMAVNEAILRYGEGSAQVADAKRVAYEEAAQAAADAAGYDAEAADELVRAKMEAYDLALAVDKAAENAKRLADNARAASGYLDGTQVGSGNAGDGYSGVSGGGWGGSFWGSGTRDSGNRIKIYIPEQRPLQEYFDFVEDGLNDLDSEIKRFSRDNAGVVSNALLQDDANPQKFWESFKTLAIDSYGSVLENLFSDGGAATNAIGRGLEGILNKYVDAVNRRLSQFNSAVANINPMDAVRRLPGGGLRIDTDKFKSMESSWFNTSYDVLGSYLEGQLGGRDGSRSLAQLVTKIERTRGVNIDDADVNADPTNDGVNPDILDSGIFDKNLLDGALTFDAKRMTLDDVSITHKSTITEVKKLNEVSRLFGSVVGSVQDRVRLFGDVIGGNVEGMAKVLHKFRIDLGKDGKASGNLAKLITAEFEEYSDRLAKRVLKGRDKLKNAGETWTDALERIAQDFVGVTATMKLIGGFTFKQNVNGAGAASDLVQRFGGIDAFNEATMAYFGSIFSPEQQDAAISSYIRDVLDAAGVNKMPKTRQELQDMINRLDLTTARGQQKYTALLSLVELFDQILPAWDSAEEAAQESLSNRGQSFVLKRLDKMISKAKEAQSAYGRLAEALADTAEDMRKSALTPTQAFKVLRREWNDAYKNGLTGDLDALEAAGGAATAYLDAYANRATNAADLRFQTAVTANKLDQLSDTAKVGEALSEYQVKNLEKLSEQIEDGKIRNKLVQKVVDAVGGMDKKTFSAIGALFEAQTGKKLKAVNRDDGSVKVKVKDDDQLSYLSNVTADVTSGGGGSSSGVTAVVSASTDDQINKLRVEMKTLIRREIRVLKRSARYQKNSMRTLEDIYENGLP